MLVLDLPLPELGDSKCLSAKLSGPGYLVMAEPCRWTQVPSKNQLTGCSPGLMTTILAPALC